MRHTLAGGAPMLARTLTVYMAESAIAEELARLQESHPDSEIGSYPFARSGRFGTAVVIRSTSQATVEAAAGPCAPSSAPAGRSWWRVSPGLGNVPAARMPSGAPVRAGDGHGARMAPMAHLAARCGVATVPRGPMRAWRNRETRGT